MSTPLFFNKYQKVKPKKNEVGYSLFHIVPHFIIYNILILLALRKSGVFGVRIPKNWGKKAWGT
jgi:hypothetical protein